MFPTLANLAMIGLSMIPAHGCLERSGQETAVEDVAKKSDPKTWLQYCSRKRITHRWMQVNLLARTDAKDVLELGPAMGAVTALLDNAGYCVTTLDFTDQQFDSPKVARIMGSQAGALRIPDNLARVHRTLQVGVPPA